MRLWPFGKGRSPKLSGRGYQLALPGAELAIQYGIGQRADADVLRGLARKRAASRREAQNNALIAGFITLAKRNVLGGGLRLKSKASNADAVETAWKAWGRMVTPDGMSWWKLEQLMLYSLLVDGEAILHVMPDRERGILLRPIDPGTLDHDYNADAGKGRVVSMGVEPEDWKVVAYHFKGWKDVSANKNDYLVGRRYRIPAEQIIFLPWTTQVGQTRGMPYLTPVLITAEQMRHYENSELIAARLGAKRHGYITTPDGGEVPWGEAGEKLPSESEERWGKDGPQPGTQSAIEDAIRWFGSPLNNQVDYDGTVTVLEPGQQFQGDAWDHPNAVYESFVMALQRSMASGLGTAYHQMSGDLSRVNFSAGRLGEIGSRQTWMMLRRVLSEGLHDRVFAEWVKAATLLNQLPGDPMAYGDIRWVGEGWQHIQPREQARADEVALASKSKSLSEIIRERGEEPAEVFEEIAADKMALEELGLAYPGEKDGGGEQAPQAGEMPDAEAT